MKRLVCLLWICVLLCGCTGQTRAQATHYAMSTVMDLQIWGEDAEAGISRAIVIVNDLEELWSVTDEESVLSRLNRGEDIQLEAAQLALLNRVEELSQRTGGAFDPKLRQVSAAWGFYDEAYRVPTARQIADALADPQLDLGAALKGYAGQQIVSMLQELKIDRALLNLGGNIQTYGEKPDGSSWQIGIQDPAGGDSIGILSVTGTMAVVTSGSYQRYFERDGARYHHILDPNTGWPAVSGLSSVTVISSDGLLADALSTALFVMGLEEATEFWRQSTDFEAVFILTDGSVYATEGAALSGCAFEVIAR